jgi:pimeloyl-ACP methyl ester carboxylesterase
MAAQPLAEIHGLILLAPLAFSTGVLRRAASVLQIPLLGRWAPRVVDWLAGPWMGGVRRRAFAPQEPPPRAGPSELQELKRGLVTELMDLAVLAPSLQRLQAGYGHLSLPVRVIAGAADRILPADLQARRLAARLPRGTLEVVPGGGHMVQFYAQEAIVAAVEELVAVQPRSRDTR